MPDRRFRLALLLLAPALTACAVAESAPPRLAVELPAAPPSAPDTIPAAAAAAAPAPTPAAEPEAGHQERWNAPFAVRSSGRPAARAVRQVVVLEAPSVAPASAAQVADSAAATAARAAAPARKAARPAAAVRTHRVEWAETWYGIARRYSVSPSVLAAANPGVDPEKLRAGEVLSIPRADAAVARSEGAARTHRVGQGDTLWGIARRYGVSLDRLRAANEMKTDRVRLGQTLKIPAADPVR